MNNKACIFNIQKFSIHDGPGIRTVVFFKGCPLNCQWCSNPESQNGSQEPMWDTKKHQYELIGNYQSLEEIIEEIIKDQPFYEESGGGVTLSGGEILYQSEFVIQLLKELQAKKIHTAGETTGYAKPKIFADFIKHVDLLYFDVKHYDSKKHQQNIGVSNKQILKNLEIALENNTNLIIRIPVIPNFNNSIDDAKNFAELFHLFGIKKVELLPFHQFGEEKYSHLNRNYLFKNIPQLHTEELNYFKEILESHQINCHVQ